jgi:hypothetical protein
MVFRWEEMGSFLPFHEELNPGIGLLAVRAGHPD